MLTWGWVRKGGVNFFLKETLLTSATNVPLMKKRSDFGDMTKEEAQYLLVYLPSLCSNTSGAIHAGVPTNVRTVSFLSPLEMVQPAEQKW